MKQINVNITASTDGKGLWSDIARKVKITELSSGYMNEEKTFMTLNAIFTLSSWNVREHGLIYTDKKFIKEFRAGLVKSGFSPDAAADVSYSEQGLQGHTYVNFDCSLAFIAEWLERSENV